MALSERIREEVKRRREKTGLNQTQFSQVFDVPYGIVTRFERGDRRVDIDLLEMYAKLFGTSVARLVQVCEAKNDES